jgi:branched-chain amino acid transport system substrate-binding protein
VTAMTASRFAHITSATMALTAVALLPWGARAADAPFEIDGIMAVTGFATAVGSPEAQTLGLIEAMINQTGGIKGRPIKFNILDDQSSPQLTSGLIAKKAAVVVGPSFTATCSATAPLIAKSGPVSYCLSPGIHPKAKSYAFSASVATSDLAPILIRYVSVYGAGLG